MAPKARATMFQRPLAATADEPAVTMVDWVVEFPDEGTLTPVVAVAAELDEVAVVALTGTTLYALVMVTTSGVDSAVSTAGVD